MIPDGVLSTQAYFGPFIRPVRMQGELLRDYELAGDAIRDGTKGMQVRVWTAYIKQNSQVWLSAPGVVPFMAFDRGINILELCLAFDNNMNPFIGFREGPLGSVGNSFIWWFDSFDNTQKFTALASGVKSIRCCVDEHRSNQSQVTDVVLTYIRGQTLYALYQRERYTVEHSLQTGLGANAEIVDVSMNRNMRLMWWLKNTASIPGAAVFDDPKLGDIVKTLCRKGGISPEHIDVSELYDQSVIGFKINTDDGVNKRIDALREMFFFDKAEADKTLRFNKRGRSVVVRIPYIDLVADDPSALEQTRLQEKELARSVSVNHLDPAGGFATNKQTARRRSNMIKATKDQTVESEVVLTADQAMTAASIKLKIAWHELQTFKFATTLKYAQVVSTDVVEVEDKRGNWYRVRITERNDNHPIIKFEAVQDAGQDVYSTLGVGQSLPPPTSTTPGLVGETTLEILNIPTLRDQDDELGVYVAVAGASSAWYGSQILISTDGGVNFYEAMQIETPATLGETLTDVEDEISAEYPANQSFEVLVNFALESVTYENLLNNVNRCVVGDELMQFQFAVLLGMVDGHYRYRLSGLVRGRYATPIEEWPTGTRFVLLDSSIAFLQAQQWMLGQEIQIKPVSLGLTEDETVATGYDYLEGVSQREFPVHSVTATRDGSNNVTVNFVGRGRLGIETAPRNGKYFAGYRVKFSNGNVIDTQSMTAVYNSAPAGITVQVCALNSVTGEGPYSTAIST